MNREVLLLKLLRIDRNLVLNDRKSSGLDLDRSELLKEGKEGEGRMDCLMLLLLRLKESIVKEMLLLLYQTSSS